MMERMLAVRPDSFEVPIDLQCLICTSSQATAWLMEVDKSLICVSSWNDYGFPAFRWRPDKLMRTSFFPGVSVKLC